MPLFFLWLNFHLFCLFLCTVRVIILIKITLYEKQTFGDAIILLFSSMCVDSKYDLSDVNTDDAVMGESWVAPLGMGYVTSDDVVNVEKVPSIREVDGAYVMIYDEDED